MVLTSRPSLAAKAVQVKRAREQADREVAAFKAQLESQLQVSMQQVSCGVIFASCVKG